MSRKNELQKILKSGSEMAIYVHYPFCKSKCPYCDFNSHVREKIDHESFLKAYEVEIEFFGNFLKNRQITSIFFGGGTPSLMPTWLVAKILEKISKTWQVNKSCEITLEANPTSVESQKFCELKKVGINRLSLGIQALNDSDLKFLGREHSAKEAILAIETAQKFFDNFSFDLIYARPNQSVVEWKRELETAIKLNSKHLSLYQLTIEKGTKFFGDYRSNKFKLPSEDLAAELYEATNEMTAAAGFVNYEISNYAKNSGECLHNLCYWQGGEYLGIGAGAHSRLFLEKSSTEFFEEITLQKNASKAEESMSKIVNFCQKDLQKCAIILQHEPMKWLNSNIETGNAVQSFAKNNEKESLLELILMGLRLKEGISEKIFVEQISKNFEQIFEEKKFQNLQKQGFIVVDQDKNGDSKKMLKIPESKRILTNSVISKLCDALKN